MACWLLGFLGFSVSRLVGLSTSYSFVYYFILCHIELYEYIYNIVLSLYLAKVDHTLLYFNIWCYMIGYYITLLYHTISYHMIWSYIIWYDIIRCYIILYHMFLYFIMIMYHSISYHILPCHFYRIIYFVILYHVLLYDIFSYIVYVMSCSNIFHYIIMYYIHVLLSWARSLRASSCQQRQNPYMDPPRTRHKDVVFANGERLSPPPTTPRFLFRLCRLAFKNMIPWRRLAPNTKLF